MASDRFYREASRINTPAFVIDESKIEDNLKVLCEVKKRSGAKILLALKAFSMFSTFPLISKYLDGICASGLNEAKLGREEFRKEVHTYAPAFKDYEFDEILSYSDTMVFNSISQWDKYKSKVKNKGVKSGIRINPEESVAGEIFGVYDPCSKGSRLGVKSVDLDSIEEAISEGINGIHFHALCEQGAEELKKVLETVHKKFGSILSKIKWINLGGGHHITKEDYNINKLCSLIKDIKKRYPNIEEVYLEPGEAVVLNSGVLVASVLDLVNNETDIAILDVSVETHLPDVMITRHEKAPYVPEIVEGILENDKKMKHEYILAGVSCAAGDIISKYSFSKKLKSGDKITFLDAAHYSMVKTNTFNGVKLADIWLYSTKGEMKKIREFSYEDFKTRLS